MASELVKHLKTHNKKKSDVKATKISELKHHRIIKMNEAEIKAI